MCVRLVPQSDKRCRPCGFGSGPVRVELDDCFLVKEGDIGDTDTTTPVVVMDHSHLPGVTVP